MTNTWPALVGTPGIWELLIILGIVMLLFGATKIPRLMRGLGQGIHEFKKGLEEGGTDGDKIGSGEAGAKTGQGKAETDKEPGSHA